MKFFRFFLKKQTFLAIFAGLLLAVSFPKINLKGFAWIAPGLILFSAWGQGGKRAFWLGYTAGITHYLASLYWLLLIPVAWFPILGWSALSAFLALFPAVWVWLCWKFFPAGPLKTREEKGSAFSIKALLHLSWSQRLRWSLFGAALWVANEMVIARIFSGFPWNLLGETQYKLVPLIQMARVTGIYGVSFLIVWSSLSFMCGTLLLVQKPMQRTVWMGDFSLPLLTIVGLFVAGYFHLVKRQPTTPQITVAFVQPSIPQTLIWDADNNTNRFQALLKLSADALTNHPDLLLWPEAAFPGAIRYDDGFAVLSQSITSLVRSNEAWMVLGGDDLQTRPNAKSADEINSYNSSFLISPSGNFVNEYRKRNLVVFGEYIPLIKWLPFIKYLTPIDSGYSTGERNVPFYLKNLNVKLSVLICFEDVFPHLVREYVSDDTDFLVNITNDGWFGEGSAQEQHAAAAVFRSVENAVPLLRCANNGLTCWIDESGRMRQIFASEHRGIYGPGYMLAKIPTLTPHTVRPATYYRLHGDVFGWLCVTWSAYQIAVGLMIVRKNKVASFNKS